MNPRSLDGLRDRLRQEGLSARYLKRLTAELMDHFVTVREQYVREGHSTAEAERLAEQRLGDEDTLYEEIVRCKELQPFVRRHPTVSFVLGPVPILIGAIALFGLLGTGLFLAATRWLDIEYTNPTFRLLVLRSFYAFAYTLTPLLALGFCQLAARHRCSALLALLACLTLCVLGGLVKIDLVLCPASGSIKFFQRVGLDLARFGVPLIVFAGHTAARLLIARRARLTLGD